MSDNIRIKTTWYDEVEDFFEIEVLAQNQYARVIQVSYLSNDNVEELVKDLTAYLEFLNKAKTLVIGELTGDTPPGFL